MLYIFSNHPHAVDSGGVWRWFIRSGPDSKTIALLETRQQILETTAVGWCYMCRTHVRYSSASSSALLNITVLENSCHTRQGLTQTMELCDWPGRTVLFDVIGQSSCCQWQELLEMYEACENQYLLDINWQNTRQIWD